MTIILLSDGNVLFIVTYLIQVNRATKTPHWALELRTVLSTTLPLELCERNKSKHFKFEYTIK